MKWIKRIGIFFIALVVMSTVWVTTRPNMDELGIPYAEPAPANSTGVTVKWYGISTLLIDDGETQLLSDGFFSRPSLLDMALKRPIAPDTQVIERMLESEKMDRLAAVFPVHSHYDHAMDSADIARLTGAQLMGSSSSAMIARSSGLPDTQIQIVDTGHAYTLGKFQITFFPSHHAPLPSNQGIDGRVNETFELPAPYTAWQLGEAYAILIEHPEARFIIQGSAGFIPNTLKGIEVDAVFLGTGGLQTLSHEYVQSYVYETVTLTNPATVYTVHHDNLFGELGNVEQSPILPTFDATSAFELSQLILPARLQQMRFAQAVEIVSNKPETTISSETSDEATPSIDETISSEK